ncbi:MAG: tRNA dihydrouridine synthase DusB, partial [Wenzhouxiangellaceae bacterium]
NVERGAEIIDLNMGCPAKKVCKAWAGSALMRDEKQVEAILRAVVEAVDIPVTLKIRTGWAHDAKNAPVIARIAEDSGIQALAIHGRTRDQKYQGEAEYDTIAAIKQAVSIPVWANGDVDSPTKAKQVLDHTGADGLLIGRAAQGRPWVFEEIRHFLDTGQRLPEKPPAEVGAILIGHLEALHAFYGPERGVRIARKHLGWYVKAHPGRAAFLQQVNRLAHNEGQIECARGYFERVDDVIDDAA